VKERTRKRLVDVEDAIWSQPIPTEVTTAAFEHFRTTGELPANDRVAVAVARRVKHGRDASTQSSELEYQAIVRDFLRNGPRPGDPFRDQLIKEAICAPDPVGEIARILLVVFTQAGHDFTGPVFADRPAPKYGTAGKTLLNIPGRWVKPPYEEQGARLLAQLDDLHRRLPRDDEEWDAALCVAITRFQLHGERPDDELMMECILAYGEMAMHELNAKGRDVAEEMAAFDAIQRAETGVRGAAIERLQAMAASGRFRLAGDSAAGQ
jgi:hypothetical protein